MGWDLATGGRFGHRPVPRHRLLDRRLLKGSPVVDLEAATFLDGFWASSLRENLHRGQSEKWRPGVVSGEPRMKL
jgi:hypothetical protein